MRYEVSDIHSTLEEPNGFWYIIDTKTKKRFGFGFTDYRTESEAQAMCQWLNLAYTQGWNDHAVEQLNGRATWAG